MRLKTLVITFLLMSVGVINGHCATTSYDNTFTANDVFASDFHTRLNANFTKSLTGGINNISTANVLDDTLTEADMADEINPRIRTYEGASCEKVESGLLPATDSDLTSDISAGTAYPRGYRVKKSSATTKTYTASKWTYVDVDINGDFQYSETAIGASAPSVATNSIRLAKVSTDSTAINTVTDLRTTSCTNGPFSNISSATSESNLDDMFRNGSPVRRNSAAGSTPNGYAQGFFVTWDTHTTFKVTSGAAFVNGEYRSSSSDITVPQTADEPSNGVSGIVSGSIGASTKYYVYLVADYDGTKTPSVSFGTSPTGLTNYRLIGQIKTDATNLFTSRDILTVHGISEREIISGWANIDGSAGINNSFNVSGVASNGIGDETITWDTDFNDAYYAIGAAAKNDTSNEMTVWIYTQSAGSVRVICSTAAGGEVDCNPLTVLATGDMRQ